VARNAAQAAMWFQAAADAEDATGMTRLAECLATGVCTTPSSEYHHGDASSPAVSLTDSSPFFFFRRGAGGGHGGGGALARPRR
jgi:TPR repeat protein